MLDAQRDAPVYETGAVEVLASPEAVWDTLTDLESWPQWSPGVKAVTTQGPFAVGSRFEWKAGPGRIKSEVVASDRPSRAAWRGRTFGITAVHAWTMEPRGPATTHVHSAESWSGLLPRLLPAAMRKMVRRALDDGLPALKAEAETRSGA